MEKNNIKTALQKAEIYLEVPGVVGVGEGENDGEPCIVFLSAVDPNQLEGQLPSRISGYEVRIEFSGEISAQ